jgi:DNA excision repair protein ERCC-5
VDLSAVTEDIPKKFTSKEIFDLTDDIDSHADPVDHDIVSTSNKAVGMPIAASNVVLAATATATVTDSNKTTLRDTVTDRNHVESDVVDSKTSQENTPLVSSDDIHHMLLEEEMQESALRSSQVNALRDAEKITEMMRIEVMQLLDAFSIPYIVAPFEAEAQCAVLEELGLVDGVITEDSDVFLFGAKTVYKNIFKDKQNVEVYLQSDIVSGLGLTREELVGLAYFLGSDYTEGVLGVGIVNAVEIIQCFPMKQEDGGPLEGLNKFKKWLDSYDFADTVKRLKSKRKRASTSKPRDNADSSDSDGEVDPLEMKLAQFTERHHHGRSKWKVDGTFPDKRVAEAYMKPPANRDVTPFEFNVPMLHRVRGYCHKVLGWSEADMNTQIDPIIRRFAENSRQSRIDSYFMRYEDDKRFAKIQSSRLAKALDIKISDKSSSPKKKQGDGSSKAKKTTKKQKKET